MFPAFQTNFWFNEWWYRVTIYTKWNIEQRRGSYFEKMVRKTKAKPLKQFNDEQRATLIMARMETGPNKTK